MYFATFKDDDGLWRWRLHRSGKVNGTLRIGEDLAQSPTGHPRERDAYRAFVRFKWAMESMSGDIVINRV